MDQQSRIGRRRAWLERQAKYQEDGTYLVRPFGWLPPVVYKVDAATKDRWVNFLLFYRWVGPVAIVGSIFLVHGDSWYWSWEFLAIVGFIMVVGYGGPLIIVRQSQRVSRHFWLGPAVVGANDRYSRPTYLVWMIVGAVLTVFLGYAAWSTYDKPDQQDLGGIVVLTLAAATATMVFAARYWRARR